MNEHLNNDAGQERQFHTYTTHYIPWFVRLMWVAFWIGAIWYVIQYAIPMARDYFRP